MTVDLEKTIKVSIEGITPLICNAFTDAAAIKATEGTSSSITGDKGTPKEQAESKLYIGLKGKPMIPQPNLFRCIMDAGKYFKAGKSKVTTIKSSIIPSCLSINAVEIPIIHKEPWEVDTRPVRNPATGGRFLCHRPKFEHWRLDFEMVVDTSIIGLKLIREIVDAAGKRIGLGDFRPDCKGPFGKFVVRTWHNGAKS